MLFSFKRKRVRVSLEVDVSSEEVVFINNSEGQIIFKNVNEVPFDTLQSQSTKKIQENKANCNY